jgi:hypothetical protein
MFPVHLHGMELGTGTTLGPTHKFTEIIPRKSWWLYIVSVSDLITGRKLKCIQACFVMGIY